MYTKFRASIHPPSTQKIKRNILKEAKKKVKENRMERVNGNDVDDDIDINDDDDFNDVKR